MEYLKELLCQIGMVMCWLVNAFCSMLMLHFIVRICNIFAENYVEVARQELFYELEGLILLTLIFLFSIAAFHKLVNLRR